MNRSSIDFLLYNITMAHPLPDRIVGSPFYLFRFDTPRILIYHPNDRPSTSIRRDPSILMVDRYLAGRLDKTITILSDIYILLENSSAKKKFWHTFLHLYEKKDI